MDPVVISWTYGGWHSPRMGQVNSGLRVYYVPRESSPHLIISLTNVPGGKVMHLSVDQTYSFQNLTNFPTRRAVVLDANEVCNFGYQSLLRRRVCVQSLSRNTTSPHGVSGCIHVVKTILWCVSGVTESCLNCLGPPILCQITDGSMARGGYRFQWKAGP